MSRSFVDSATRSTGHESYRTFSVVPATVMETVCTEENGGSQGRVKVKLLSLGAERQPWARVATPMAGPDRGLYIMPQVEDEVLVAFNLGDVNEAYVIGCLWNGQDRPPIQAPEDAVNKRIWRTPEGHVIELDDGELQSIKITNIAGHKVTLGQKEIALETSGGLKVTIDEDARKITVEASDIVLQATDGAISLQAKTIQIQGDELVQLSGGASCTIDASLVRIN